MSIRKRNEQDGTGAKHLVSVAGTSKRAISLTVVDRDVTVKKRVVCPLCQGDHGLTGCDRGEEKGNCQRTILLQCLSK